MKKIIIISILVIIVSFIAIQVVEAKLENMQHRPTYEYTLENGTKGYSKHCFDTNGRKICRDIKTVVRVIKFEEVE